MPMQCPPAPGLRHTQDHKLAGLQEAVSLWNLNLGWGSPTPSLPQAPLLSAVGWAPRMLRQVLGATHESHLNTLLLWVSEGNVSHLGILAQATWTLPFLPSLLHTGASSPRTEEPWTVPGLWGSLLLSTTSHSLLSPGADFSCHEVVTLASTNVPEIKEIIDI